MQDTNLDQTTQIEETDRRLLALIQQDATLTAQALGERLNLSASQAARRRQRLEARGIVRATRAVLDPQRVGLGVQAFIQVVMATHTEANARDFAALTRAQPEIVGAWTLTGEADYLLRVYCTDLDALNRLVQNVLLPHPAVSRVQSRIVMDRIKPDAPLPL
ncbi:MAG: transcriptional regulator [Rhodobacteraceae bacterium HLUCCO18]|nr:MAG: transcriptional regulator [Rhodobacteraceae bacterium HLUCCO18]